MKNTTNTPYKARRDHKDRVFRMIFNEKRNLLSLYNALNGTNYNNPADLTVVTLENAVYMGMKNDVSFIFDSYLSMYEHQSTFNPNMPLRFLQYVSEQYEKLVPGKKLYSSKQIRIPEPRFIVFYNGLTDYPETLQLKLSDAYEHPTEEPELELRVRMYNINYGKNKELLEKCNILKEYSQYVECVRKYMKICDTPEETMNCAIRDCINNNILKDFLMKNRSEVLKMSIYEYNEKEVMEMWKEEEYERGLVAGKAEGQFLTLLSFLKQGRITLIEAAQELGISVTEFERLMRKQE